MKTLGEPWADRLVSAEKLVSDFRSRRVASEIVAFGEAAEKTRRIWERALSNEVITPGVTALEDVAWWIWDRIREEGLDSAFDMPSVYITGPEGVEASSNERIIQRADVMMIDGGICYLNFCPDVKRTAYVLKEGEGAAPAGFQHAFDQAVKVREVIRRNLQVGRPPRSGSVHGSLRATSDPGNRPGAPTAVTMYWRPSWRKVMGAVVGGAGSSTVPIRSPVALSTAWKRGSPPRPSP